MKLVKTADSKTASRYNQNKKQQCAALLFQAY